MRSCDLYKCYSHWDDMNNEYVNEAVRTVAKDDWNMPEWQDCTGTEHLRNMINGWLGELIVKFAFPELKWYGDDHGTMNLDRSTKDFGKADLISEINGETVEVKTFGNPYKGLLGKKKRCLHNADKIYVVSKYRGIIYEAVNFVFEDNIIVSYDLKVKHISTKKWDWVECDNDYRYIVYGR